MSIDKYRYSSQYDPPNLEDHSTELGYKTDWKGHPLEECPKPKSWTKFYSVIRKKMKRGKNNKLIAARTKSGKTQLQVAQETGLNIRMYQNYEYRMNDNAIKTAIKIAIALGSTVEQLWGGSLTTA